MKKFLPTSENFSASQTKNNPSGFTLIELLVVIAIIAVLAVMGMAVFSGLTGRGNDARRRADLKAISDALEVKKGNNSTYQTIAVGDFAGGTVPSEPARTAANTPRYCYTDGTAAVANPSAWTTTTCPASGGGNGTGWMQVGGATVPTVNATATFYLVCGMAENNTDIICFRSKQ